jgi:cysteine desulfuration protein SufE
MPSKLAEIVDEFASAPRELVLEMLLEFADAVPPLPAEFGGHEGMEQVPECQTQFFLKAVVQPDDTVLSYFECPPEAPTTRAFAGILAEGLAGASTGEILAVPDDLYARMGLSQAISPLRIRGGTAILGRLKRQIATQLAATTATTATTAAPAADDAPTTGVLAPDATTQGGANLR